MLVLRASDVDVVAGSHGHPVLVRIKWRQFAVLVDATGEYEMRKILVVVLVWLCPALRKPSEGTSNVLFLKVIVGCGNNNYTFLAQKDKNSVCVGGGRNELASRPVNRIKCNGRLAEAGR